MTARVTAHDPSRADGLMGRTTAGSRRVAQLRRFGCSDRDPLDVVVGPVGPNVLTGTFHLPARLETPSPTAISA